MRQGTGPRARVTTDSIGSYEPLIRWAGSKRAIIPKLLELVPDSFGRYVEPFVGSAALFLNLRPSSGVLGDINKELLDALRVLRRRPEVLHEKISSFQMTEDRYYELRAASSTDGDWLSRAARFFLLNPLRVLVDYSSMTKTLYSTILSFFALHGMKCDVELTFSYTIGEHVEFDIANANMGSSRITEIIALPGFEGALPRSEGMTAIFGLGFETLKPISVAERLETQSLMAFIADPGAFPDYARIALQRNEQFISNYLKREPLRFPIRHPTAVYRALGEIVAPFVERHYQNVQLVPLGPKPHVLASLLTAIKYPAVTVLQVSSARVAPEIVKPLDVDPFVITRVSMARLP